MGTDRPKRPFGKERSRPVIELRRRWSKMRKLNHQQWHEREQEVIAGMDELIRELGGEGKSEERGINQQVRGSRRMRQRPLGAPCVDVWDSARIG